MQYLNYIKQMSKGNVNEATCSYCGYKQELNSYFCTFCEIGKDVAKTSTIDTTTLAQLTEVHNAIIAEDLEKAEEKLDALGLKAANPYLLYVIGVLFKQISDIAYFGVDYTLKGFMPENAETREKSLRMEAKSKEFFYKAIYAAEAVPEPKEGQLLFIEFLSYLHLDYFPEAKNLLDKIPESNKKMKEYAEMAYAAETNSKQAEKAIEAMLKENEPNAFYYLAKYLAKNQKANEAERVLKEIEKVAKLPIAYRLKKNIEFAKVNYE